MVNTKTEIQLFTSFDVSRAGDELVKLLLGKESERGAKITETEDEEIKNVIPAEGILLCDAIVDVADQEGSLGFVEEIFKVMDNRGEGLVT